MSYPLCYHNPMMKMKEQLFKVTLARWEDGTATTTHVSGYGFGTRQACSVEEVEERDGGTRSLSHQRQRRIWRICKLGQRMSNPLCYTNHMMKMKNEEMELVNDNGTWKIKWNDGFERSFESFFKAKLHFVALVNQQIAMER